MQYDECYKPYLKKAIELLKKGNIDDIKEYMYQIPKMPSEYWVNLIIESGNIEKYLTTENCSVFEFSPLDIKKLIIRTGNIQKYLTIRKCREFNLVSSDICELIKETRRPKKYLNTKFCRGCRLDSSDIADLIESTGQVEKYINPQTCKELGLNTTDICDLISRNKKISINSDFLKGFGLTSQQIFSVLSNRKIQNLSIKQTVKYGLEPIEAYQMLKDKNNIKKYPSIKNDMQHHNNILINLPEDMTIGVELESVGKNSTKILREFYILDWNSRPDGSLTEKDPNSIISKYGVEVVSPILRGNNQNRSREILFMTSFLKNSGQYTNETCGGHIHIGADFLTSIESYKNLIEIWTNSEKILYIISNRERELPRNSIFTYAFPISGELEKKLNNGSVNLNCAMDFHNFKNTLKNINNCKYGGINFINLDNNEKKTIEFRLPNGTLDYKTWIENINLYGGIISVSEELSKLQAKEPSQLSEEEIRKINLFNSLKNPISDRAKMRNLIDLVFPNKKDRDIYINRYDINNNLFLKNNGAFDIEISKKISKEPIQIGKNKIGGAIFTGDEPVRESEYATLARSVERKLQPPDKKQSVVK
ncbi:MAG: amidoligase family protein [Clostridia bacterium]|nr:amidoligase family protein [Clostridia bacterium]